MGKAQSKRSVDITTEVKKGPEDEVTGKLEKIEDIDQKQLNGDAATQERNESELEKEPDETENDKDLTTEKSIETAKASADNADENKHTATVMAESEKDDSATPKADISTTEEIAPLADESAKKSKKEKVKKKWSFRNISFGKKDKQKPVKIEELTDNVVATNAEQEKAVINNEDLQKEETAPDDVIVKPVENGNASEKIELNGEKNPTPIEENQFEIITTTSTTSPNVNSSESAIETQTDIKATDILSETVEAVAPVIVAVIISNGGSDVEKNGIEIPIVEDSKDTVIDKAEAELSAAVENNTTIPSFMDDGCNDGDKPHQNGTNGADELELEAEKSKMKIEVNINTSDNSSETNLVSLDSDNTTIAIPNIRVSYDDDIAENVISPIKDNAVSDNLQKDCSVNTQCDSQPPPLPVSSPPSQVMVFAFSDNTIIGKNVSATIPHNIVNSTSPSIQAESIIFHDAAVVNNSKSGIENMSQLQLTVEQEIMSENADTQEILDNTNHVNNSDSSNVQSQSSNIQQETCSDDTLKTKSECSINNETLLNLNDNKSNKSNSLGPRELLIFEDPIVNESDKKFELSTDEKLSAGNDEIMSHISNGDNYLTSTITTTDDNYAGQALDVIPKCTLNENIACDRETPFQTSEEGNEIVSTILDKNDVDKIEENIIEKLVDDIIVLDLSMKENDLIHNEVKSELFEQDIVGNNEITSQNAINMHNLSNISNVKNEEIEEPKEFKSLLSKQLEGNDEKSYLVEQNVDVSKEETELSFKGGINEYEIDNQASVETATTIQNKTITDISERMPEHSILPEINKVIEDISSNENKDLIIKPVDNLNVTTMNDIPADKKVKEEIINNENTEPQASIEQHALSISAENNAEIESVKSVEEKVNFTDEIILTSSTEQKLFEAPILNRDDFRELETKLDVLSLNLDSFNARERISDSLLNEKEMAEKMLLACSVEKEITQNEIISECFINENKSDSTIFNKISSNEVLEMEGKANNNIEKAGRLITANNENIAINIQNVNMDKEASTSLSLNSLDKLNDNTKIITAAVEEITQKAFDIVQQNNQETLVENEDVIKSRNEDEFS